MEERPSAVPVFVAIAILACCGVVGWWVLNSGPTQEKVAKKATVPSVEVVQLVPTDQPVQIRAFGTVQPAREVTLTPEVEGRVVAAHDNLEPGAVVREGEQLLRIDPAGYRIAVRKAEAALATARATRDLETGQQKVAQKEWALFAAQGAESATAPGLALREPQMKQAEALVATAEAQLEEARLALRRTSLQVPFDAFVRDETVEIGRRVGPSTPLATLVGIDEFWATVTMPVDEANRLAELAEGAKVTVTLQGGLDADIVREGSFVRRLPGVESEGRMARSLIAIPDPLGLESGAAKIPLGSYVRVDIDAGVVANAHRVPREALRENGQVWVRDADGKLQFRDVQVLWGGENDVYVRSAFVDGDELIVSYLPDPLPGIELRVREKSAEEG